MVRRFVVSLLVALVAVGGLVLDATPAQACSCTGYSSEEFLDEFLDEPSLVLFTGRETSKARNGNLLTLTFEVDRVFAGSGIGETVDLQVSLGTSCGGGSVRRFGRSTWVGWRQDENGPIGFGACRSFVNTQIVEAYVDGFPEPRPSGTPGFVVAQNFLDSRLALLNRRGNVMHYQRNSEGWPVGVAACPGAQHVVVASVDEESGDRPRGRHDVRFDSLSLPTLEHVAEQNVEVHFGSIGILGRVRDLQCHSTDGSTFSYVEGTGDSRLGVDVTMMNGPDKSVFRYEDAWTVGVNPQGTYAITTDRSRRLLRVHELATGETTSEIELPGEQVGWTVDIAASGRIYVLTRHQKINGGNRNVPVVNRVIRATVRHGKIVAVSGRSLGGTDVIGSVRAVGIRGPGATVADPSMEGETFVAELWPESTVPTGTFFLGPRNRDFEPFVVRNRSLGRVAVGQRVTLVNDARGRLGRVRENRSVRPLKGLVSGYLPEAIR